MPAHKNNIAVGSVWWWLSASKIYGGFTAQAEREERLLPAVILAWMVKRYFAWSCAMMINTSISSRASCVTIIVTIIKHSCPVFCFSVTLPVPSGFDFRIFSLRWREKFEKHNKLFSFSHRLWWVQALAGSWLAEFQTLRRAWPIREELTIFGCPGQRHLCTSEGRSSENWRNIKKDQGCSAIDAFAYESVPGAEFLPCFQLDLWQWHTAQWWNIQRGLLIDKEVSSAVVGLVVLSAVCWFLPAKPTCDRHLWVTNW